MSYLEDLQPLVDQIEIVFKIEVIPNLDILIKTFGESTLINKNSKEEFSKICKSSIKKILTNLSKKYIEKLIDLYFSDDGLALYIFNVVLNSSKEYIVETSRNRRV